MRVPNGLGWILLAFCLGMPALLAAFSPLLEWRGPVYTAAGFAGILAYSFMLWQPLLMAGHWPPIKRRYARLLHRAVGAGVILLVAVHVLGLYLISPMDVLDVLSFRSPTPFGLWGAIALYILLVLGFVVLFKRKIPLARWRFLHLSLASILSLTTILHVLPIEGTMESISKWILAAALLAALTRVVFRSHKS